MFEFLVNRICPLFLVAVAVAAIDTPGNFVRKWVLAFMNYIEVEQAVRHLPF